MSHQKEWEVIGKLGVCISDTDKSVAACYAKTRAQALSRKSLRSLAVWA